MVTSDLTGRTLARWIIFVVWLALVLVMAAHHAFWRDEVRAYSLAIQGGSLIEMLRGIRGEGHPAVWYLLLRGAHDIVGSPAVLSMVSVTVASAAALILLFLSPFPLWFSALILGTNFFSFEYAVMARNYGISLLLMFLFSYFYPIKRQRGPLLGVLLALLCNTNAHSVVLAGAFLLFWGVDLLGKQGLRWTLALRTLLLNAVIAAMGVAVCFVTIYPPVNDAVTAEQVVNARTLTTALLMPAASFPQMALYYPVTALGLLPISNYPNSDSRKLMSVVLFASVLILLRLPAALLAAVLSLVGLSLFFVIVYHGDYRHEALWLAFLISLYWITCARGRGAWRAPGDSSLTRIIARVGFVCMLALLAMQVPSTVTSVLAVGPGHLPKSRVRELGALLRSRDDLQRAIVIADPDFVVEALPYYTDNPIYFLREDRFGKVTKFTNHARLALDLDDILRKARELHAKYRVPVVIVMQAQLDADAPEEQAIKEGYNLTLRITPSQTQDFLGATDLLGPLRGAETNEDFDVYQLKTDN